MSTTVASPSIKISASAALSSGAAPAPANSNAAPSLSSSPAVGSSAFNVNKVISQAFSITSGTPFTIDLNAATDPLGGSVSMSVVTDIILQNLSVTAGEDMTLGGAVSNFIIGALPVLAKGQPQGSGICLRGIELAVDGTHKILEVTIAAGTAVAGQITVMGR